MVVVQSPPLPLSQTLGKTLAPLGLRSTRSHWGGIGRTSMNDIFIPFLTQLAGQSPVLFVYLVGMVLALVFWRRYPRPCAFTLIAVGLLILTSIGQTFVNFYFVVYRGTGLNWEAERLRGC